MSDHHDAGLLTDALQAAVATRGGGTMPAMIFHTDRGAVYTSAARRATFKRLGCANQWAAPGRAWITPPPSRSSPP